jgi:hypothetical protein
MTPERWSFFNNLLREIEVMLPNTKMKIVLDQGSPPYLCIFKEARASVVSTEPSLIAHAGFLTEQDMTGTGKTHQFSYLNIFEYNWKIKSTYKNQCAKTAILELYILQKHDSLPNDTYRVITLPSYIEFFLPKHDRLKFVDTLRISDKVTKG